LIAPPRPLSYSQKGFVVNVDDNDLRLQPTLRQETLICIENRIGRGLEETVGDYSCCQDNEQADDPYDGT
jgi:hypothetical protein